MDKSLDEIVAANKKGRIQKRGAARRSSARAQVLGSRPATATSVVARTRSAAAAAPVDSVKAITQNSEKIIVSNLPQDVNEDNIREFFVQTVGAIQSLSLSYDAQGRSKGVATVTFSKKGDAQKAFKEYNNRLIDRKRPMKIEIVVDPSKPAPLASRVAPAPAVAGTPAAAKPGAVRGAGRRRGRGGARKGERPQKSAADLDAEMEDYTANTSAPAAAAAPAV